MTSATYYPEFDEFEIEETIQPLSRFDSYVLDILAAGGSTQLGDSPEFPAGGVAARRDIVQAWCDEQEQYPFQRIVRYLAAALAEMNPVEPYANLFQDPDAILLQVLCRAEGRVRDLCTRSLVATVNHAREQGLLAGETPQARYQYFVTESVRNSSHDLGSFQKVSGLSFPVLADLLPTLLRNVDSAAREMFQRIVDDRDDIAAEFGIAAGDRIVSCGFSEGDSHHHGRSVSIVEFESGERLVYKPRDVSCEAAYATIVGEFNDRLGTELAAAHVLRRDGYGFVEFIESQDVSEVSSEFMYACGELGAVLYLLNARDMHFENIMPTTRGPIPVDLETILHPARPHTGPTAEAIGNAYDTIGQSIYGIGILPLVMAGRDSDAGHVDLGFLGDQGRGNSPFKSMHFQQPFTDTVRLVLQSQQAQQRRTVVHTLTEDEVHRLGERMSEGFSRVFRAAMSARDECARVLADALDDARVRYVHNPTALYAQTLRMTAGAGATSDPGTYLALLKRIAIASKTSSPEIVVAEMRQLAERDVPYFTVSATSVRLRDGSGAYLGATFSESPLARAQAKIAKLSEFELDEQLTLIRSAFASRFPDNHLATSTDLAADAGECLAGQHTTGQSDTDGLVALATRLARKLAATSVPDRFAHLPRTWIGPLASSRANRPWPPGVIGYDLYTGRVGPALALAAAGRALDVPDWRTLAEQIFAPTADILSGHRYETRSIKQAGFGGYTGMAGILFALASAGRVLDEPEWITVAQDAVPLVMDQVTAVPTAEHEVDVIGGLAGVLLCVQAIGGKHAETSTTALCSMLVEGLHGAEHGNLLAQSGFAHGVSGLVYTLCRSHPMLPVEGQMLVDAQLSTLVERLYGFFDEREGNWFSNVSTQESFSTGWCHGATGIALALSAYHELTGDPTVRKMRDNAVGNLVRHGFGRNLTWCHGDLGNHDVLTTLAGNGMSGLQEEATTIERRWLNADVFGRKIADTRSRYANTSSLMVGTSGVLLHLVNRLEPGLHISPVTLTSGSR